MNDLISCRIINDHMSTNEKMKLFKIYIKPLLTFGCETLDLNDDELKLLKTN